MNFICVNCGAIHQAVVVNHGTDCDDDVRQLRKAVWHKSIERLHYKYSHPSTEEQIKDAEAAEIKACSIYMNTIKWSSFEVPDTLASIRMDNRYHLVCVGECGRKK